MSSSALKLTKEWIEEFVIGYNLCPFAAKPFMAEKISYHIESSSSEEQLTKKMLVAIESLITKTVEEEETSFVVVTKQLGEFEDFLNFVDWLKQILVDINADGIVQIADFHPHYQFDGTEADDPSNFTNRSPFPMIHLLRDKSIEQARKTYPGIEDIPQRNIALMQEKGFDFLSAQWAKFKQA